MTVRRNAQVAERSGIDEHADFLRRFEPVAEQVVTRVRKRARTRETQRRTRQQRVEALLGARAEQPRGLVVERRRLAGEVAAIKKTGKKK